MAQSEDTTFVDARDAATENAQSLDRIITASYLKTKLVNALMSHFSNIQWYYGYSTESRIYTGANRLFHTVCRRLSCIHNVSISLLVWLCQYVFLIFIFYVILCHVLGFIAFELL